MEQRPVTQVVPISQARQHLGELINQVYRRQIRIILEKGGIPVAALISLRDLERFSQHEYEQEVDTLPKDAISAQPPSEQELARRQALVAKILANAERRVIAPLTTAELVRKARAERQKAYERWTR